MALRLRRGTDAQRQLITPAQGELIFVTDTTELYVGDGSTQGGIRITGQAISNINDLGDVDAALPQDGDVLIYDSATSEFVAGELPLGDLSNVDTSGVVDGSILEYDSATQGWVIGTNGGGSDEGVVIGGQYFINIVGSDSSLIVDADTGKLQAPIASDDGSVILENGTDGSDAVFYGDVNAGSKIMVDTSNARLQGILRSDDGTDVLFNGATADDARFIGTVQGNVTGDVTGDLKGSMFADDSSVLIDSQNQLVYASVAASDGTEILNPGTDGTDAEFTGTVKSFDGSTVLVDATNSVFTGDLNGNVTSTALSEFNAMDLTGTDPLIKIISEDNTGTFGEAVISIFNNHTGTYGQEITFNRSNGTHASPTAAVTGDFIGSITVTAHDGTNYTASAAIHAVADAVNGTDDIDSSLRFYTRNGSISGDYATALKLTPEKGAEVTGYVQFGSYTTTDRDALTAANGMVVYNTTTSKFQGYAGGSWVDLH